MSHALYLAVRHRALGCTRAVPEMPFLHPLRNKLEARRVILGQKHARDWQIDFAIHKAILEDRRLERAPP